MHNRAEEEEDDYMLGTKHPQVTYHDGKNAPGKSGPTGPLG